MNTRQKHAYFLPAITHTTVGQGNSQHRISFLSHPSSQEGEEIPVDNAKPTTSQGGGAGHLMLFHIVVPSYHPLLGSQHSVVPPMVAAHGIIPPLRCRELYPINPQHAHMCAQ